ERGAPNGRDHSTPQRIGSAVGTVGRGVAKSAKAGAGRDAVAPGTPASAAPNSAALAVGRKSTSPGRTQGAVGRCATATSAGKGKFRRRAVQARIPDERIAGSSGRCGAENCFPQPGAGRGNQAPRGGRATCG